MSKNMFAVREMRNDGTQSVYILDADQWTLHEFQMWLFGFSTSGHPLHDGSQRNEILGYYPNVDMDAPGFDTNSPLGDSYHEQWRDPDNLPDYDM